MFISEERAQQIVREIKDITRHDLNLMDENGCIIASTDPERIGQKHPAARQLIEERREQLTVWEDDEKNGMRRGVNLPIVLNGELAGVIGVTGDPDEVAVLGCMIRKMAEVMLTEVWQQEISTLYETARFNFVERWLFSRNQNRESFEAQAGMLNIDLNVPRIVAVFLPEQAPAEPACEEVLRRLRINTAQDPRHLSLALRENYLILFAGRDMETVHRCATAICHELSGFFAAPVYCGISTVAETYQQLPECYREALAACRTVAASKMGFLAVYDETSPRYILQAIPRDVIERLEAAIFRDCSQQEKEEILRTLTQFFRHDGNSSAAAEELYIHPNTFLYRLRKAAAFTGLDPRRPRDAAVLYLLSFRHILGEKEAHRD